MAIVNTNVAGKSLAKMTPGSGDASWLLEGATMWLNGQKIEGAMPNKGAWSQTITPSASEQTIAVPYGYHNGGGKVNVSAIPTSTRQYVVVGSTKGKTNENGTIYTPVIDAGTYTYKIVAVSTINCQSCILQGSNDNSSWSNITTYNNSDDSSNDTTQLNTKLNILVNQTYRYYRLAFIKYYNGTSGTVGLAVARSTS